MTLQGWREQMTAKGITHNDAVRMLKDAEAEIEQLRAALRDVMSCGICHGNGVRETTLKGRDYRTGVWSYIPCECRENARRVLGEVKE